MKKTQHKVLIGQSEIEARPRGVFEVSSLAFSAVWTRGRRVLKQLSVIPSTPEPHLSQPGQPTFLT